MGRRRFRSIRQRMEDASYDINLAPMLDMMVALVPFLLLSIAFVRLTILETKIPQPVAKAIEEDRNNKDRKVEIKMYVSIKNGVKIVVDNKGSKKTHNIPMTKEGFNTASVHSKLVSIKQLYPEVFRLEVIPNEDVVYKDLIGLMDTARMTTSEDPQLFILDKETNKQVPTKLMFPDVLFGNVVGS